MKMLIMLAAVITVVAGAACAGDVPRLSVAARVPLAVAVQLTLPVGVAIEAGLAATGPAVFAAKLYLRPWRLGEVPLVPAIGLGGAIAFLPGDLIATGFYGLVGLELPIAKTHLSLLADVALLLPWPLGAGTLHVAPQVGVRFDF